MKKLFSMFFVILLGINGFFVSAVTWESDPKSIIKEVREADNNIASGYNMDDEEMLYHQDSFDSISEHSNEFQRDLGENSSITMLEIVKKIVTYWLFIFGFITLCFPIVLLVLLIIMFLYKKKDKISIKKLIKKLSIIYGILLLFTVVLYCVYLFLISSLMIY